MSIFIEGRTCCGICREPIGSHLELVAFSPFVANQNDPISVFNDGCFHKACFQSHPLSDQASEQSRVCLEVAKPRNRLCYLCGDSIDDPDNYIACGYLTGNTNDPLSRYNFAQFHRSCLLESPTRSFLAEQLIERLASGRWKGAGLVWLANALQ